MKRFLGLLSFVLLSACVSTPNEQQSLLISQLETGSLSDDAKTRIGWGMTVNSMGYYDVTSVMMSPPVKRGNNKYRFYIRVKGVERVQRFLRSHVSDYKPAHFNGYPANLGACYVIEVFNGRLPQQGTLKPYGDCSKHAMPINLLPYVQQAYRSDFQPAKELYPPVFFMISPDLVHFLEQNHSGLKLFKDYAMAFNTLRALGMPVPEHVKPMGKMGKIVFEQLLLRAYKTENVVAFTETRQFKEIVERNQRVHFPRL